MPIPTQVGLNAFNDAILLETCLYTLLKTYFGDKPYYPQLLDDFHMVRYKYLFRGANVICTEPLISQ